MRSQLPKPATLPPHCRDGSQATQQRRPGASCDCGRWQLGLDGAAYAFVTSTGRPALQPTQTPSPLSWPMSSLLRVVQRCPALLCRLASCHIDAMPHMHRTRLRAGTYSGLLVIYVAVRDWRRGVRQSPKHTWPGFSAEALQGWGTYLRLALPAAAMICGEW